MKIIEFFGLPMSGKSYFVNLIFNHRKKNNFSNDKLFIKFLVQMIWYEYILTIN